ncbi:TetR family transcriptional regulator [Rhizobium sp. ERR 922]|uniref:TetR/AcrR family transcriptional regulator n=1 Tax=unclassified Rhizobium TaxID=2613769 RepID=UPI0011A084C1|nr:MULTISPECIES: TetR/AcrR family transcriptional regulator [unclassified Rhizobium]TWB46387.1 TetR family transcriptional regulator [Rhizobium sp. ERR 922]TWB88754.1 TetR family transcriptional regulator [Rhizobium sp. ERR 942]
MARPKKFNRETVLDKAIPVFWRYGLAGTNVQQLEAATGVNKSGIYSEFENKDDMFVEALRRYLETGPALRILAKTPLGLGNIEQFLSLAPSFSGNYAGCLSVNSTRDIALLPDAAVRLISDFNETRMAAIRNNVEAELPQDQVDDVCDLIWTFFSGICIDANLNADVGAHRNRVQAFMRLLRSSASSSRTAA